MINDLRFVFYVKKLCAYCKYLIENNIVCYRKLIIYEKSLDSVIPKIETKIEVHVRPALLNDIKRIAAANAPSLMILKELLRKKYEHNLLKRQKDGHICFIAEEEKQKIAAYCWAAFREIYITEIHRKIELSPEEADLYDAFVFPEYRGKKIYQKLLAESFRFLSKRRYKRVYGHALSNNIPSRRGIQRVGYKPKKVVTLLKVFGLKKYNENDVGA